VLLGTPALVIAGLIAVGAVVAGMVGPRLHRRHLEGEARSDADHDRFCAAVTRASLSGSLTSASATSATRSVSEPLSEARADHDRFCAAVTRAGS
jgi:hypothetical protein